MVSFLSFLILLIPAATTHAFVVPQQTRQLHQQQDGLAMAPRFDKSLNKFVITSPEEGPEAGYDPVGSLLRQGPAPFLQRIFRADDYEQAVLKFMAVEKCDRMEAQGNMDAYLRNAQDWAYMRMESEKRGIKLDYVTLDQKQIVLTSGWSVLVVACVARLAYSINVGENFWQFLVQN